MPGNAIIIVIGILTQGFEELDQWLSYFHNPQDRTPFSVVDILINFVNERKNKDPGRSKESAGKEGVQHELQST